MCEAKFSIEIGNGNPKLLIRVGAFNTLQGDYVLKDKETCERLKALINQAEDFFPSENKDMKMKAVEAASEESGNARQ